jgi:hypothetical protein
MRGALQASFSKKTILKLLSRSVAHNHAPHCEPLVRPYWTVTRVTDLQNRDKLSHAPQHRTDWPNSFGALCRIVNDCNYLQGSDWHGSCSIGIGYLAQFSLQMSCFRKGPALCRKH